MKAWVWVPPALASALCAALLVDLVVGTRVTRAAKLVLVALLLAGITIVVVLALTKGVLRRDVSGGLVAVAVTLGALIATPIPIEWSDSCNSHSGTTYAATAPYVLLARPEDSRLVLKGAQTLIACEPVDRP
jgi:hypothetical protein